MENCPNRTLQFRVWTSLKTKSRCLSALFCLTVLRLVLVVYWIRFFFLSRTVLLQRSFVMLITGTIELIAHVFRKHWHQNQNIDESRVGVNLHKKHYLPSVWSVLTPVSSQYILHTCSQAVDQSGYMTPCKSGIIGKFGTCPVYNSTTVTDSHSTTGISSHVKNKPPFIIAYYPW